MNLKGSTLIFSLIVLSFLLISALSVATIAVTEKRSSLSSKNSNISFQVADSAAEAMLQKIYKINDLGGASTISTPAGLGSCSGTRISGNAGPTGGSYVATLYESDDTTKIACNDTNWRTKIASIKLQGIYQNLLRAISITVKPLACDVSTVTDADGNIYDTIQIGTQCWMKQNMRVGTRVDVSTHQLNNGVIEKFCYTDNNSFCTSNNPNRPDGGLYLWDEAMQYETTAGARGICPAGWHIPTDAELYALEHYLDSSVNDPSAIGPRGFDIGTQLQPNGTSGLEWNLTGHQFGLAFTDRTLVGFYWSSSEDGTGAWYRHVNSSSGDVIRNSTDKQSAFSVRCLHN